MKRILMFMFVLLGLVSIVNADLTDNNNVYYSFDSSNTSGTTMNDLSINGNDGTCTSMSNCNTVSGKLNEATDFDGINDRIILDSLAIGNNWKGGIYSISVWVYLDSSGSYTIYSEGLSSNDNIYGSISITSDKIAVHARAGASSNQQLINSVASIPNTGVWTHIVFVNSGNLITGKMYINGVDSTTTVIANTGSTEVSSLNLNNIGTFSRSTPVNFFNGKIDEFAIYDIALTSDNVSTLYNSNISFNPYSAGPTPNPVLTYTSIKANNVTLTNNTFYNSSIDFETVILNTSTNGNVNHTYSLNGAASVQYTTNSLNGSVNLNLSEGSYNISFSAFNNETSVNSSNYSFIVDLTAPVINIIGNVTQDTFFVNFSTIFDVNYSISGRKSCSLNITYLTANESDSNFLINCTDTQTFTRAGLYNGFLTAEDNAGNIVTGSVNGTINPVINIFFNQTNGSLVLNYSATIFHPDGRETIPTVDGNGAIQLSPINNGSLDLGLHTIQFEKLGFATENFTQIVNATNAGTNTTFNVSNSVIVIKIFDRDTEQLLTGLTSITMLATNGFNGTTTTGLLNVSDVNFLSEQYQILAEHEGYNSESVFFNYNNQEVLNVNIYMLNSTIVGQIEINLKNSLSQFVEGGVCSVLEWKPALSSFVSIAQGLTNVNGETILNIELNTKIYQFSCTKDEFTTITDSQIIQVDNSILTIILDDEVTIPDTLFPNLVTSMTNTTLNSTHQLITYNFADADGLTTEGCIKHYFVNGNRRVFSGEQCVESSTGQILLTLDVNSTEGILVQGVLTAPGVIDYVTDQIQFKGVGSIADSFKVIGLDVIIPTILILLGLALGILMSKIEIAAVLVAVAGWVSVAFVPTILRSTIAMFITVIVGLMIWGGYKK